jgi:hypothetical protein
MSELLDELEAVFAREGELRAYTSDPHITTRLIMSMALGVAVQDHLPFKPDHGLAGLSRDIIERFADAANLLERSFVAEFRPDLRSSSDCDHDFVCGAFARAEARVNGRRRHRVAGKADPACGGC